MATFASSSSKKHLAALSIEAFQNGLQQRHQLHPGHLDWILQFY
jgi:hypothetical protein